MTDSETRLMSTSRKKIPVVWLSRHPLSREQLADLAAMCEADPADVDVEMKNVTWQATPDCLADIAANAKVWRKLIADKGKIIAGVFPPVALEALETVREQLCLEFDEMTPAIAMQDSLIWTPVSAQDPAARADSSKPIAFKHLRWTIL